MRQTGEPGFTVGVEEEFQLVDARTGELRSRARAVLATDWTGEIHPEMQQNTVEVQTRVCASTAEARGELARLRLQAAVAAEARGLRVVAGGTHPFSHWAGQEFTPSPTYDRIRSEYRRLAETQNIFGLHVHVSVPAETDRAAVVDVVRHFSHLLLALSASSPLFLGDDTGYASYRWILWRRWPRSGSPPRLGSEAQLARLVESLVTTGCMDGPGRLYWDVRPHHTYPTVEFRAADVTPRLEDVVAIAALARALVVGAVEGVLDEPAVSEPLLQTVLVENAWRAARYGLQAEVVDLWSGEPRSRPIGEALTELAERLAPLMERLGDAESLARLEGVLARGGAAGRIRERWESDATPAEVVRWLADETVLGLGMDRRQEQRTDG